MSAKKTARNTYRKLEPLWEKLVGLYSGDWVRLGFYTKYQTAAESAIYKFLSRYPELKSPEDVTVLEARHYLKTESERGKKQQAIEELKWLEDFWMWLIYCQSWFLSNPFLEPLKYSRWKGLVDGESKSLPFLSNNHAATDLLRTGRKEKEPPLPQSM